MGKRDVRGIGHRLLRHGRNDDLLLHRPSRDDYYDYHYRYCFNFDIFDNLDLNHSPDRRFDYVHEPVLGQLLRRPSELHNLGDD